MKLGHMLLLSVLLASCATPPSPGEGAWEGEVDELPLPVDRAAPPPLAAALTVGRALSGSSMTLTASGFPAGTSVIFLVSSNTAQPGACPAALQPACLDVAAPYTRLGARVANAAGQASITYVVPNPGPRELEFQAYGTRLGVNYLTPGVTVSVGLPLVGSVEGQQIAFGEGAQELRGDPSLLYDVSTSSLQIQDTTPGGSGMTLADPFGVSVISTTHTLQANAAALSLSDGVDALTLGWSELPELGSTSGLNVALAGDLRLNGAPGLPGQVLTSGGAGAAPTWTSVGAGEGALYAPDAWDVSWAAADGDPTLLGWTLTAGTAAAATVDGVPCYEMVPDPVVSSYLQRDLPALDGNFELRVWMRAPSEGAAVNGDYNIVSYYTGVSLNKTLSLVLSSTGLSLNVSGSTLTPFSIPLGNLGMEWVSVTMRVVTAGQGQSGAVLAWVGDTFAGSVTLASVSQPTVAPQGRIRIGKAYTNAGVDPAWQLAFFGFRGGFNDAPPTYTYRGTGFGSYGPR
jgi:hypothetical protein